MPELAYVNGKFSPIGEAVVSVEDRGFQFGDGVYEVVAAYRGRPFLLDRHLARMRRSCEAIRIAYDFSTGEIESIVHEGLRRSEIADAAVYLQITRGVAPRSHVIPQSITPTVVMTIRPLPQIPNEVRRRGLRAMTMLDNRWPNCYIKAVTLLPNVLAKNDALAKGFDEAIYVTSDGEVRECTSANVFVVDRGKLLFPPLNESILHGVTLGFILECARGLGIDVTEGRVTLDALRRADEVFLSSTMSEVLGITFVDHRPIADGHVGPMTIAIFDEFRRRSRASTTVRNTAS